MNNTKIGFIGSGKMAGAIIRGLVKTGFAKSENLMATQAEPEGVEEKSKALGIKIILDNKELVEWADVIFVATKPNQVEGVLGEICRYVNSDKLVVSIAAGVTTAKLESNLPDNTRVIRVMPNTPALVGEGMSGMFGGKYALSEDINFVKNLLSTIGECIVVETEPQLDIVTAISGSGPAFFYKVINEIARAGEKLGMDYEKALLLSIQTAIGSAKMAKNREISMEQLISNVATKGGCTAVGVDRMNDYDTEKLFYDVISDTTKKACELGK
ncbi:pyrroline-5-carboxylate reductase [bacterium]|nr:pyrroline-5-carboxylate reductase [bacterium]